MDYKSVNFKKVKKEELTKKLIENKFENLSAKEKKDLFKTVKNAVEQGDYLVARNALVICIYFYADETFSVIKKSGVFRYSKYISKKCITSSLANELISICNLFNYNSYVNLKYLNSIIAISNLHKTYNDLNQQILEEIRLFKKNHKGKSLIKSLLSYVDFLFLSNHYPVSVKNPLKITSRSKEEICSAISYLIFIISELDEVGVKDTAFVAEEYIKNGEIERIVIASCSIIDFKEFELLIEHFNYECKPNGDKLKIIPPYIDFEKSIRLGYIRSAMQNAIDREKGIVKEAASIEELAIELSKSKDFTFFKLTLANNYPRYRVEIPEPVFDYIIDRFFKPNDLFREEIDYLQHIFKEQLLNYNDLNNIKVRDDLTLMEFIKVKRVFYLFYFLFTNEIYKKEKVDSSLLLRSLIPVYEEDSFYDWVGKLISTSNLDSFLDIVCWEPDLDVLFDLQYHPILFLGKHFVIPLSVLINSNSVRNLFASEYKQNNLNLFTDGTYDPVVEKLYNSFTKANINCYKQTSIPQSDIDLFTIYENTLFLFECKQSLYPTSLFDLRTTFDYVKKAEMQLDHLNKEYSDGRLIGLLEKKYSIDLSGINNVVSCIVLSNRLFNGNAFKYPIRNVHEIENIIERGTMTTATGQYWLWKENELCLDDLLEYFSLNSSIVKHLYDSLSVRTLQYELTTPNFEFDSYYLDIEKSQQMIDDFTKNLRKVDEEQEQE